MVQGGSEGSDSSRPSEDSEGLAAQNAKGAAYSAKVTLMHSGSCRRSISRDETAILFNPSNIRCGTPPSRIQSLGSDNLVQTFNNLSQFLWRRPTNHFPYPFDRERSDLADFDPRLFWKPLCMKFKR